MFRHPCLVSRFLARLSATIGPFPGKMELGADDRGKGQDQGGDEQRSEGKAVDGGFLFGFEDGPGGRPERGAGGRVKAALWLPDTGVSAPSESWIPFQVGLPRKCRSE